MLNSSEKAKAYAAVWSRLPSLPYGVSITTVFFMVILVAERWESLAGAYATVKCIPLFCDLTAKAVDLPFDQQQAFFSRLQFNGQAVVEFFSAVGLLRSTGNVLYNMLLVGLNCKPLG